MQVSIRELKANPARAIAMAHQGERVQITSHRKVVAELVQPVTTLAQQTEVSDEEAVRRLVEAGFIAEAATKPFKLPAAVKFAPSPDGKTMSDLIVEMRGPR